MSNIAAVSYDDVAAVTKSDTDNDPAGPFAGLFTGSGGNISIVTPAGSSVVLANTAAGIVLPIRCIRVNNTGTVATSVVGLKALP